VDEMYEYITLKVLQVVENEADNNTGRRKKRNKGMK